MIGVGMAGLAPPLPPNRTGGFPASGSPVSGFSARLTISTRALFQTKQPLRRKPSVGPPSAVGLPPSVAGSLLPFAQHRPPASPQPSVRTIQARRVALPEVAVPAAQDGIGLGHHLAQAPPVGTPGQRAQLLLQFLKALLARPFLASAKVPAQEVEAFGGRLDDARLGRMEGQPCFLAPLTQRRQRLLRFFLGPAPPDQVIRVADPFPAPLGHRVVQRIEIPVRPPWTDDRPLGRALLGRLPAFQFFQHSGFESLLPQGEDTPLHHSLPDQPEQSFVRNRVEVALEIQVPAPRAALTQWCLAPWPRLPTAASGSKPVALLGEVLLEDRFEHVFQGRFHPPVAHRRYAQRSLFPRTGLGDPGPARRLPAVALAPQFFPQFRQFGLFLRFKLRHGLTLDSRGAPVGPDRPEGGLEITLGEHFVPESLPYGCRLAGFEPG